MKACPCPLACRHCQVCWAVGKAHPEYASAAGYGSHVASHRRKPAPPRPVVRDLDRGEREYVRRRLNFMASALAAELRCTQASVLAALPKILREPRRCLAPIAEAECMPSGPGIVVGVRSQRGRRLFAIQPHEAPSR